jgi:glycosyltransferase involved in cell wall biosynthesis
MRFSVIIPAFNRADCILPTLKSVQGQTCRDFECLVVDDGSSDDLKAVVESLNDDRFRYLYRVNRGANAARNRGIDEAVGDYVAFLDSDDLWLPNKLEVDARELDLVPDRVLYSNSLRDRGVGKLMQRRPAPMSPDCDVAKFLFVQHQFIQTPTICLKRNAAASVRWDEELKARQDFDFCLRLREHGFLFHFVPERVVIWRDVTDAGRTSHIGGLAASLRFLEKNRHLMSWRARLGYRANVLAFDLAKERPLVALRDLALGLIAGVSPVVIGRQFLRTFMPRDSYRKLVNRYAAVAGRHAAS